MSVDNQLDVFEEFVEVQKQIGETVKNVDAFRVVLESLIKLTDSKYGYIAEVQFQKLSFLTAIMDDWGSYSNESKSRSLDLHNMDTMFGLSISTGDVIITDDLCNDPRRGGVCKLPEEHPEIKTYIAIPVKHNGKYIGQIGLANRIEPYNKSMIENLEIFINKISSMMLVHELHGQITDLKGKSDIHKTKNLLMANVSHEIRTPLNTIIGMLSILEDTPLDDIQWEYIQMMRQSTYDLLALINDILDISKLEAGEMDLKPISTDIEKTIQECYDIVGTDAKQKGLSMRYLIDMDVPNNIIIDKNRLKQMLKNLLSNAVKFTNYGSVETHVSLATQSEIKELNLLPIQNIAHQHETKDKASNYPGVDNTLELGQWVYLKFSIVDTGVGIKDCDRSKLFKSFTQIDSSSTKSYGGTGLGLSITYQLCDLMRGYLSLDSKVGKGSTFYFVVPVQVHLKATVDEYTSEILRGKNFLVVDDNYRNLITLTNLLNKWGVNYRECESGQRAYLSYVENPMFSFDLGLIDIVMPNMNGNELAEKINKSDHPFPLIALSSLGQNLNDVSPIFSSSLSKPYTPQQLLTTIVNVLKANTIIESSSEESSDKDVPESTLPKTRSHEWKSPQENIDINELIIKSRDKTIHKAPTYHMAENPNLKILIAEDKDFNLIMLKEMLKKIGYKYIDEARNGKHAVEMIKKNRGVVLKNDTKSEYDIILMDIIMPEMDGMEASQIITKMFQNKEHRPKIIAVTARVVEGAEEEYLVNAEMNGIIYKPIDEIHKVAKTIQTVLTE